MDSAPICHHCHDVIGVYEPMVVVIDGQAQLTSRTSDRWPQHAGERYHRPCYAEARDEDPVEH